MARLRRRVSRLARAESASPGEDRGEIRSAPRGSASRRSAPTDFFSDQRSLLVAVRRGVPSGPPPPRAPLVGGGLSRFGQRGRIAAVRAAVHAAVRVRRVRGRAARRRDARSAPGLGRRLGNREERLREFVLDAAEFGVSRRARGFRRDVPLNARQTRGGFFDEPRAVSVGRELRSSRDDWFPTSRNRARASFGTDRRAPRRDPRFASPLRSRQRNRDAGADGAHAARADDTADERGASPPESGAHDDAPVAARPTSRPRGPPGLAARLPSRASPSGARARRRRGRRARAPALRAPRVRRDARGRPRVHARAPRGGPA